ncbi:ABC transporter ATP-binding protein [Lachnospiraceae bacterium ZAX-1]
MKIRNFKISKPYLKINVNEIDFLEHGINLIAGDNGTGKTTILESIVFDYNQIEFQTEKEKESYQNDRINLFSYVSQDIPSYKVSLIDYITKGGTLSKSEKMKEYFQRFSLTHINFTDRFDKLSGGEKMKISIISALLKDTPYIFMDEPTNHLDNEAVISLVNIIHELSAEKTFIIVCHDSRVKFDSAKIFIIDGDSLNVTRKIEQDNDNKNNNLNISKTKKHYGLFTKKILLSITNLIALYLVFALVVFLVIINNIRFVDGYSYDNGEYKQNIILAYTAEYIFSSTNELYAKAEGLEISENKYEKMITYNDLDSISKMNGVVDIILLDSNKFTNRLNDILYNTSDKISTSIFSIPEDFIAAFPNASSAYLSSFGELMEGRYPKDEGSEICIPKQDISLYSSITGNPINQKIIVGDISYTIVGVINNSKGLYLSSYQSSVNNGFYSYSNTTYTEITNNSINMDENTQEMLIYTNNEKSILNSLMTTYPATNYSSYLFTKLFEQQYNKEFLMKEILPINLLLSAILAIIILFVRKNQIQLDVSVLRDFSNYFIDKKGIKKVYIAISIGTHLLLIILPSLFNSIFSPLANASNPILLLDMTIVFIPSFCLILRRQRNGG